MHKWSEATLSTAREEEGRGRTRSFGPAHFNIEDVGGGTEGDGTEGKVRGLLRGLLFPPIQ